ncbi:cytochrome c [uncultured Psychrobacter sp.]|uniref:c-type cytochrome n=1 Tax=uncultured Psychrobacter sp. TaxID=259303 RepID=UPI003457E665
MLPVKSFKSMLGMTLLATALGLSACSSPSNPDVKARQDSMKSWSDAMGIMGDMIEAPNTFDADLFREQAAFLAEDATNPWSHFEDQEAVGNATEAVWVDVDSFRAESDNFQQVTAQLDVAAQGATGISDVQPAFKEVGASCKSCHTDFRVKKD